MGYKTKQKSGLAHSSTVSCRQGNADSMILGYPCLCLGLLQSFCSVGTGITLYLNEGKGD